MGGSIVQGVLNIGDEIEIKPGLTRKEGAKPVPAVCKVQSLMEETEKLDEARPGGLIAVGTTLDPCAHESRLFRRRLSSAKKGEVPDPTDVMNVRYQLLERADVQNMPLREAEPVVVNVHTSTGVGIIAKLAKGIATIKLKKATVVYPDMHVALSRKVGQRWRLSAWGKIV